jgi:[ribosomal protein S18]-alanine N-acetyltransferase
MGTTRIESITSGSVSESDRGRILEIERAASPFPWSHRAIEDELANPCGFHFVARDAGMVVVGFILGVIVADEFSIQDVAVHPKVQGQGIGRRLLETALGGAYERGAMHAYLEVRSKNRRAAGLYEKLGFRVVTVRKSYYSGDHDDALIMHKPMNTVP